MYTVTGIHYTKGKATECAANVCKLFVQNYWVTLDCN